MNRRKFLRFPYSRWPPFLLSYALPTALKYEFDMARAVKGAVELEAIRDSMSIIVDGFYALLTAYEPGKTEAQLMAPAVELFFARGRARG